MWLQRRSPVSIRSFEFIGTQFSNFYISIGAADTTLAAVTSFMAAMLISPRTQRMAHDELDRVLSGRLPDFNDEHKLPYISAIVREVLR